MGPQGGDCAGHLGRIKGGAAKAALEGLQDLDSLAEYTFVITAPGGQSTALAPAVGLVVGNDNGAPDTKLDVSLNSLELRDANGLALTVEGQGFINDAGTVGANGLDTGALAAASQYYLWVIGQAPQNNFATLLSLSPTSPALPAGWTYKRLISGFFSDGSAHLPRFHQAGAVVTFDTLQAVSNGAVAQNWTDQDLSALLPGNWRAHLVLQITLDAACDYGLRAAGTLGAGQISGTAQPLVTQDDGWVDTDFSARVELYVQNDVTYWGLFLQELEVENL